MVYKYESIVLVLCWLITAGPGQTQQHEASMDTSSQSGLEAELAQELAESGQSASERSQRPGGFQNMNPNISAIGTFLGSWNDFESATRNIDLSFEEAEFSLQAAVDPYASADIFFAFHKHHDPLLVPEEEHKQEGVENHTHDEHGHSEEVGYTAELEEAFFTLLAMPWHTQLKAGKYRMKFGKINETHPHAYHFIDVPYMYSNYFGPDGLNDEGVSLSWLIPNKAFFQDLTIQVTNGPIENASFTRAENNRLLYLAHLENFFEISDNTTLELGLTGLTGPNSTDGDVTDMLAADLTLKWKPVRYNRYRSFELMAEALVSRRKGHDRNVNSYGLYSFLRYQIGRRWFLGGLVDYAEFPEYDQFHILAYSGIAQFLATEFQKVELQYRRNTGNFFSDFNEVRLRAVFVIGSHGAHEY